ncbi:MAG: DMT family transporter [Pseudodonghicola sp.]
MSDNLRGALFMVLAMMAFAGEDAFYKIAAASLAPGFALLLFGLLGLAAYAALARGAGQPVLHPAILSRPLLVRSAFEITGRVFFALSLAYTPLSTTSAILQATPLVVTLGAALLLGESVGPRRWAAMAVGFLGVLLILRPTPEAFRADAILAVIGMIGFAGRDLATRASSPAVSRWQLGVLGFLVVAVAGLVMMAFDPAPPALPAPRAALALLATAGFGVTAYTLLTQAMRVGEISVVAPFRYSRLLIALLIAFVVFGERPDALTLAGGALIVASGLYTLWRSGRAGGRAGNGAAAKADRAGRLR